MRTLLWFLWVRHRMIWILCLFGPGNELIMSWLQADGETVALRYSQYEPSGP